MFSVHCTCFSSEGDSEGPGPVLHLGGTPELPPHTVQNVLPGEVAEAQRAGSEPGASNRILPNKHSTSARLGPSLACGMYLFT